MVSFFDGGQNNRMQSLGDFGGSGSGYQPPGASYTGQNQYGSNLPTYNPASMYGSGGFSSLSGSGGPTGAMTPYANQGGYSGNLFNSNTSGTPNFNSPWATSLGEGTFTTSTLDPNLTNSLFGYLGSQVGQGVSPYQGQLTAGPNRLMSQIQKLLTGDGGNVPGMSALMGIMGGGGPGGATLQQGAKGQLGGQGTQYSGSLGGLSGEQIMKLISQGGGAGSDTLQQMSQTGAPTDVGPEWNAMKAAQQQGITQNAQQLKEQMGAGGNLVGTPYGNTMGNFYEQTTADQNSLLGQMQAAASEAAAGRRLSAGGLLQNNALSGATDLTQSQLGAAGALSQEQIGAAADLQGNALSAGNTMANADMQQSQAMQQVQQLGLTNQFNEWLRTQPYNNPLLQMQYGAATTFPGVYNKHSTSGATAGGLGSMFGSILGGLGGLFGGGGGGG